MLNEQKHESTSIAEYICTQFFQSGGKQHRVSEGQVVRLEKLEVATGETVEFDSVLMIVNGEDVKNWCPSCCWW